MKKLLAILLCVAMACSLVACGGGNSSGSTANTGNFSAHDGLPEGEVNLLVHLQNIGPSINEEPTEEAPDVFNSTRYITQAYEGLYPNVKIEFFRNFKSTDAPTQIEEQSILVAGGTCADLFFAWGNTLQGTGWLQVITDYMSTPNQYEPGNESWKDMYYDYMWDADKMTMDAHGEIVSVPFMCHTPGTIGVFYNKQLFQEHGAEIPTTWQELCDLALEFRENGITGYAPWTGNASIDLGNWDFWSMLSPALAVGYEAIDLDGDKVVTPEEDLKAAFEGWYYAQNNECVQNVFRLYKYKYATVLDDGVEGIDYSSPWLNGKVAMLEDGLWRVPTEASNTKRTFDYGLFLHPFVSTDTDVTVDGHQVKLDDASKIRVPEKTESGPEKLDLAMAFNCMKPEIQERSTDVLDYCIDYLKFLTATENMNIIIEEKNGGGVGATKTAKTPGALVEWMSQPFNKALVGTINTTGYPAGDSASKRKALLEEYVKDMITEEVFFLEWDKECYANFHEYAEEQGFDISGFDVYVPNGVDA